MTTKQMEDRLLSVEETGYGHWRVTQQVRGRKVSHYTTNAAAVDRWMDGKGDPKYPQRERRYWHTYKEALTALLTLNACAVFPRTGCKRFDSATGANQFIRKGYKKH